ncbi:MAG: hypothetical protein SF052_13755 [Bacteroidia bacterium]|nr:hypothetical protein [Bacteroidia bacterium]
MKKTNLFTALSGLLFVFVISACSPIYYSPNTHNVPMLREKGDKRIVLAANDSRLEGQVAFSPEEHLGILFDAGTFFPRDDEEGDGGKGWFVESGFGYYHPVAKNFTFDIYGILGYGYVENHFPSTVTSNPGTTGLIESNLFRYGIQPSFGFNSKFFDAIISARFAGMQYFNYSGNLIFQSVDQVTYLEAHKSTYLFEPALTLRGGYDKIKLQLQLGPSYNLKDSEFRQDGGHITLGITYGFSR